MDDRPDLRWWLREVMLSIGAVLGCLCLVAAAAAVLFGVRPLVFRSGSMSPAIETGALGVARTVDAAELRVGDIVSVTDARGTRITHRIVEITPNAMTATLVLKGDANRVVDAETYEVRQADRVWFAVPALGYVVGALSSPWAIFLGGALVGVLVMIAFPPTGGGGRRGPPTPPTPPNSSSAEREPPIEPEPRRAAVSGRTERGFAPWARRSVVTAVVGIAATVGIAYDAEAAWADSAAAQSGSFAAAARVSAPSLTCSGLGLASVRFTWTAVAAATDYELTLTGSSPSVTTYPAGTLTATLNGLVGSGTATVRARIVYPNTIWYSVPSNSRSYLIVAAALCS